MKCSTYRAVDFSPRKEGKLSIKLRWEKTAPAFFFFSLNHPHSNYYCTLDDGKDLDLGSETFPKGFVCSRIFGVHAI